MNTFTEDLALRMLAFRERLGQIQQTEKPQISVSLCAAFMEGNVDALVDQNQQNIAQTLQNILDFACGCERFMFGRVCSDIGVLSEEVYEQKMPYLECFAGALEQLLEQDMPEAYRAIIRRSGIAFSLNYGSCIESLDGEQNNAVNTLNEIFNNRSGGGDPSLFVDAPVCQEDAFHFLLCESLEKEGLYNIFEYWIRVGFKGFPPVAGLLMEYQRNSEPMIPTEPVVFCEIYAAPSTRSDFFQVKLKQQIRADLPVTYVCQQEDPGYYFVQNKSVDPNKIEKLPVQYYIPDRLMHIADVFQELKLAPLPEGLFEWEAGIVFTGGTAQSVMYVLHRYFNLQINYLLALRLAKAVSLQQLLITKRLGSVQIYQLHKEFKDVAQTPLVRMLGFDALSYLDVVGKISLKQLVASFTDSKQYTAYTKQKQHDTGMVGTDKVLHLLRENKVVRKTKLKPELNAEIAIESQFKNSSGITQQFEFLRQVYGLQVDAKDRQNIFHIEYDKQAMIAQRCQFTGYSSFLPDLLSIPGLALHPFATNKDVCTLQLDLGCYPQDQRLQALLILLNELPTFWTVFQSFVLERLNLQHFESTSTIPQFSASMYKMSGAFLSIPIFDTLGIQKIILTAQTPGEDDVSIVANSKQAELGCTVIVRAIRQVQTSVSLSTLCSKNPHFPASLRNEFEFFFTRGYHIPQTNKFILRSPEKLAQELVDKLRLDQFSNVINFARQIQQTVLHRVNSEFQIKTPIHFSTRPMHLKEYGEQIVKLFTQTIKGDQNKAVTQYCHEILKACSVFIVGLGQKTKVFLGANQCGFKVQLGKVCMSFDSDQPIYSYLRQKSDEETFTELAEHNQHLRIQEGCRLSLLTLTEKKNDYQIGILDNDYLNPIYIPAGLFQDSRFSEYVGKETYVSKCSIIIRDTNQFINATLIIEMNQNLLEAIVFRKVAQERRNADLPHLLQTQQVPLEEQSLLNEIIAELLENPHLYPARLHAVRHMLDEIASSFGHKAHVYALIETFFFGNIRESCEALAFASAMGKLLYKNQTLPVDFSKASFLVFNRETSLKGDFPLNLLLIGPHEATVPRVCEGIVAISQYLIKTSLDEIMTQRDKFDTDEQFIEALAPASVFSSRSFNTIQQLMLSSESGEEQSEADIDVSQTFEHETNAQIDKILGSFFADGGSSVYIADQDFYGFQLTVVCAKEAWHTVCRVQALLDGSEVQDAMEYAGAVIGRKVARFWMSLK